MRKTPLANPKMFLYQNPTWGARGCISSRRRTLRDERDRAPLLPASFSAVRRARVPTQASPAVSGLCNGANRLFPRDGTPDAPNGWTASFLFRNVPAEITRLIHETSFLSTAL